MGAVAVATLLAMILPGAAAADDDVVSRQPVVVVADFPGSMNTADADTQGMTRVDAAKQSVNQLLASSPADARLGLVVFGTQSDACSDIRTLNPRRPI